MTATYDGKLAVNDQGVSPCCRQMDYLAFSGLIYISSKGGHIMLKTSDKPKRGVSIAHCPFCGAGVQR